MTTVRVTAPATSPVSLDEAKAHLRVDHDDDNSVITGFILAAVSHLDGQGVLGRAIITQTWAQWVSQSPGWVRLTVGTFQSLTSVQYYDADNSIQTATLSHFETRLDGDFVWVKPKADHTWPLAYNRNDAIKLTYVAGYGDAADDVPQSIRQSIMLMVGHWYDNREATTVGKVSKLPLAVDALIGGERIGWYG